ncbi:MAG: serine/threonine protein phosphatase PrpC/predicted Ser/Thr protein kinase [Burkholderiaceae bacterium]|jgi:serine/threonine protein phosphatase PrpC/predicted Ser/Thr protein kinase
MPNGLKISAGQYSDKGSKEINQDFHGIYIPEKSQLSLKGIVIALADGISSSGVSQIASQCAVTSFLEDYYCTPEAWSVKTSAERVLAATNTWLHSQTQQSHGRYDKDHGYVCTFSAMVIKSNTAHLFHVGDARVWRRQGNTLEQLTNDHRIWVAHDKSHLSRALGVNAQLEIDYRTMQVVPGDMFIFATDGVHEYADPDFIIRTIDNSKGDLDSAARTIGQEASRRGSTDNLTLQIVRIDTLPDGEANEIYQQLSDLKIAPILDARMMFDGYQIIREVHGSSRSHVYLARDCTTDVLVIIKTPSIDMQEDQAYLERFLMEEWVARRINSAHVLKPYLQTRKRAYLYVVTEFIEGQSLHQWMIDHPRPDLETVRAIVEQIAKGLRAFHKMEVLHQDLRPENIMIDTQGTVKIIDFGSTSVAGIAELAPDMNTMPGTFQYAAPEYFLGEAGTTSSDLFSLGVITYQMLTGRLPYGASVAKTRTRSQQNALRYVSAVEDQRAIPVWMDGALMKAVHPDPTKRYQQLSEYLFDLRHPNQTFLKKTFVPLAERNPLVFWKSLTLILVIIVIVLLGFLSK